MERHHLDMCIMILNSDGNDLFTNVSPREYEQTMTVLKKAILATDIATYIKIRSEYVTAVTQGTFDWANQAHRDLFIAMLMTAADLSAIARPWEIQRRVAIVR